MCIIEKHTKPKNSNDIANLKDNIANSHGTVLSVVWSPPCTVLQVSLTEPPGASESKVEENILNTDNVSALHAISLVKI